MRQTNRTDFNDTWLSEAPTGVSPINTFDTLVDNTRITLPTIIARAHYNDKNSQQ